jgi:hypothetical protein
LEPFRQRLWTSDSPVPFHFAFAQISPRRDLPPVKPFIYMTEMATGWAI